MAESLQTGLAKWVEMKKMIEFPILKLDYIMPMELRKREKFGLKIIKKKFNPRGTICCQIFLHKKVNKNLIFIKLSIQKP